MLRSIIVLTVVVLQICFLPATAQVLNKQAMLNRFSFWHNRDWKWYKEHIPFFESPDSTIDLTYYYRWDMMTAHLVYGSPESGYASTEFISRPAWSGKFGAISCSLGHQLYEFRWFRNKRFLQDYTLYWLNTPGAQPRSYSNWLADAVWQSYKVNKDTEFVKGLKNDLVGNYRMWEKERWVPEEGLFSWDGMHDGMENNISSRQTDNAFGGAPGYRPTLNSYMWADAGAIKNIASLSGDAQTSQEFMRKADLIKKNFQEKCWDPQREFFLHRFKNDEKDGIKANSLTYQTGKYAGSEYGRELMGYIPWYFNLPDSGFEGAWKGLMDTSVFFAPYGFTTAEKKDPLFLVVKNCCSWSGNSWPFANSQTLKAMANLIRNYHQPYVTKADYFRQLKIFARTHRKNGHPYLGEANDPQTGSWGNENPGYSEHYFHSSFIDEVITGLVGLQPSEKESIDVDPLIPEDWDFFALDDVKYHGHNISIIWDKYGSRYKKGKGLLIFADRNLIASSPVLKKISVPLKSKSEKVVKQEANYAVNNESSSLFPRFIGSFAGTGEQMREKMIDGQYWYITSIPNRWNTSGALTGSLWCGIDFGSLRSIHTVKLYFTADSAIKAPASYQLEYWSGREWKTIQGQKRDLAHPLTNSANVIRFPEITSSAIRALLIPQKNYSIGISEFEAWGFAGQKGTEDVKSITEENNAFGKDIQLTSSFTAPAGHLKFINDGLYNKEEHWNAVNSRNASDWIQVDFGQTRTVSRATVYFYFNGGDIQPPKKYHIQYYDGREWKPVEACRVVPAKPVPGVNTAGFTPVVTRSVRFVFDHLKHDSFTGVYELEIGKAQ